MKCCSKFGKGATGLTSNRPAIYAEAGNGGAASGNNAIRAAKVGTTYMVSVLAALALPLLCHNLGAQVVH